jgi:hypothetical protein
MALNKQIFLYSLFLLIFIITTACSPKPVITPPISKPEKSIVAPKAAEGPAVKKGRELSFKNLKGYFLNNNTSLPDNINVFVMNSNKEMTSKLKESSQNKPTISISFEENIVIAIILKPSNYKSSININSVYYDNSVISVNLSTSAIGSQLYYFANNAAFFAIERINPITKLNFYIDGKLRKEVLFGMRTKDSPDNFEDLKSAYLGVYKGALPSPDSADILVTLELYRNSTYILKQGNRENPSRVIEIKGKWIPTDDLSSIVLNPDRDKSEQIFFYFIDKNTIEWFDAYNDKKVNRQYRLRK